MQGNGLDTPTGLGGLNSNGRPLQEEHILEEHILEEHILEEHILEEHILEEHILEEHILDLFHRPRRCERTYHTISG